MAAFPVLHYLLEFAQTHVHWGDDAIQPPHSLHPLLLLPSVFPASGSFLMSRLFASSGQSIGASASPSNEYSALISYKIDSISLVSKGLSRVFSSSTVWKHQFFRAQPSLWSNSQICMWLLEENIVLTIWTYMGILEARILEWVAMPSSKGSSQPRDHTQVSHIAGGFFTSWATGKPKNTAVDNLSLLQGIFPIQELNQGLLHWRQILCQLSYQGKFQSY